MNDKEKQCVMISAEFLGANLAPATKESFLKSFLADMLSVLVVWLIVCSQNVDLKGSFVLVQNAKRSQLIMCTKETKRDANMKKSQKKKTL